MKSGANVNARTVRHSTSLHLAVDQDAANEVTGLLFGYRVDWNSSNEKDGLDTPLKTMVSRLGDMSTGLYISETSLIRSIIYQASKNH